MSQPERNHTIPHYTDETFEKVQAKLRHRTTGPWILALPRPDLDPTSKDPSVSTDHVKYEINAKVDQVAVMHVLAKGPGRVRLGFREHIPVEVGDVVLVNLREAGHWLSLEGETLYTFTGDVPFARMYPTGKPRTPPLQADYLAPEDFKAAREAWADAWAWNIQDVLSDYVLLGRDPEAERQMRLGPTTLLHIPGNAMTDGTRSDNARDNRFPIVYRRILGVGPGKWMTRESDLGVVDREEARCEGRPGDMMAMCKTVKAAGFTFQGAPFEVIHAASCMIIDDPQAIAPTVVHVSCGNEIPFALPNDEEEEIPETVRA
jgi:hypothetical protein